MAPEELVAVACPKIATLGPAFYFAPGTVARGEELGLDVFGFYAIGRGGVLGDVESAVVASASGYFNPSVVATMWDAARQVVAPRTAGRAFMECCAAFGRHTLGAMEGLDAFCHAAAAVNDAADPVGLALYAGIAAEPLVDDERGRAMQPVAVLREFRGSAHLIALRASGLDAKSAHYIRRPHDVAMFGWGEDDAPTISADDRATWAIAEQLTDRIVLPAFAVLDEGGRQALVHGLEAMESALAPG